MPDNMSISSTVGIEEEEEEDLKLPHHPTHNPTAPPDAPFEISTTIDPSSVISLIRKLVPSDVKDSKYAFGSSSVGEEHKTDCGNGDATTGLPEGEDEVFKYSDDGIEPRSHNDVESTSDLGNGNGNGNGVEGGEKTWEECGCILWDLSSSEDHAQFMVQNLILEVLMANLMVSQSSRITEICLGIIGNLACHETTRRQIATTNGLVGVLVQQLVLEDIPCLSETCRVLDLCLRGGEGLIWAEALLAEPFLSRILLITENVLHPQLLEKIVGLLLAVLESQHEVASILLPPLMKLDLSRVLVGILAFEMSRLKEERVPERYAALDMILRSIEALSNMDEYSQEICPNKRLLELLKELVEFPDKFEVASSCVTAVVVMANILAESTDLASQLSDPNFLQALFDVFPLASDDKEAQTAIWSIIARLLTPVRESEMSPPTFHSLVSVLLNKAHLMEDLLFDFVLELRQNINIPHTRADPRLFAMKRIGDIVSCWKLSYGKVESASVEGCSFNDEDINSLLELCSKFSRLWSMDNPIDTYKIVVRKLCQIVRRLHPKNPSLVYSDDSHRMMGYSGLIRERATRVEV